MKTELEDGTVECYSGHAYAQELRALVWQGQRQVVRAVQARWRSPAGPAFRVQTERGAVYDLLYDETAQRWTITPLGAEKDRPEAG